MLVLAIVFAAALVWRVNPWGVLLALPFFAFRRTWAFAAVGMALGLVLAPIGAPKVIATQWVEGEVVVASVPRMRRWGTTFDGIAAGRRWAATVSGAPPLALGDRLRVKALGRPFVTKRIADYAQLRGLEGNLRIHSFEVAARGPWIAQMSDRWRRSFGTFCERYMRKDTAALTEALGMNLDGQLDDVTVNRLRATGTVHIISASGLHVFVLAAFLTWVLSLFPIRRGWQLLILVMLLAVYSLATGSNPPVLRSIFMAVIGLSAYFFGRDRDGLSALAVAGVVYLLYQPLGIFDIGFQLSFLTVAGLILFGPTVEDYPQVMPDYLYRLAKDAVQLSAAAFMVSAPLIAYYFGTVAILTIPANLLITMAVPVVVVGGLVAHLVSGLSLAFGVGLLKLVELCAAYVLAVLGTLGDLSWAQAKVPAFHAGWLILVYGVMFLFWRERYVRP
jgi:competence protein ComEC